MTMDRETVETLRDEPELLALADALQIAGDALDVPDPAPVRPRTRLRPARLAAVGFAVAAVVGLVLASPWSGSGGPSFVDKALAAVGDRPVVHVVVRYSIVSESTCRAGARCRSDTSPRSGTTPPGMSTGSSCASAAA